MSDDVLIVDDTPENLRVLGSMLSAHGYKARQAPSGAAALKACAIQPPDILLLDINMPEMNGFEVCARLKDDPRLREIPVLFISAHTDLDNKIKAFHAGGVDYITKPFQSEEVAARVATHLMLHRQRLELEANFRRIQELDDMRKSLTRLIVHDLRGPLVALGSFLEIVQRCEPNLQPKSQRYLGLARSSNRRVLDMANSLLDIERLEENVMRLNLEPVDLAELCRDAVSQFSSMIDRRTVVVETGSEAAVAEVDRDLMLRVIQNVLSNALKFTDNATGRVTLRTELSGGDAIIAISNNGPEIPAEYHDRIFQKFAQIEGGQIPGVHSTGLGLSLVKLGVEAHGGNVCLHSGDCEGTTFRLTLPRRGREETLAVN